MAGPKENLAKAWTLIRQDSGPSKGLILDDPTGPDRYLGCKHILTTGKTKWQQGLPSEETLSLIHISEPTRLDVI
eukprot:5740058-Prorocentrum_lima.AAC.1